MIVPTSQSALVHVPQPTVAEETIPLTIFGSFLAHLEARYAQEERHFAGIGHQMALPVREILMHGLWPLMQRVAQLAEVPFTYDAHVMDISERVDRLVSLGMLLVYGTPEEAATAFDQEVLSARAQTTGVQPFIELAQRAGATFFARLVKCARQEQATFVKLKEDLDAHRYVGSLNTEYLDAKDALRRLSLTIDYLDSQKSGSLGDISQAWFTHLDQVVRSVQLGQSTLRKLDLRPLQWQDDHASHAGKMIEDVWFNTQALLAMLGAPLESEILPSVEALQRSAQQLSEQDAQEATDALYARAYARLKPDCTWSPEEQQWIQDRCAEAVERLQQSPPTENTSSDFSMVFVHLSDGNWMVDPEFALLIATGQVVDADFTDSRRLSQSVVPAILWDALSDEDFLSILDADALSVPMVIEGIMAMDPQQQEWAVARLLDSDRVIKSQHVTRLWKLGLIDLTVDLIKRLKKVLHGEARNHVFTLLLHEASESRREDLILLLLTLLPGMDADVAQAAFDLPKWRAVFVELGYLCTDSHSKPAPSDLMALQQTLGTDRYSLLLLNQEATQRAALREDGDTVGEWTTLLSKTPSSVGLKIEYWGNGFSLKTFELILQDITEEKALAWGQI